MLIISWGWGGDGGKRGCTAGGVLDLGTSIQSFPCSDQSEGLISFGGYREPCQFPEETSLRRVGGTPSTPKPSISGREWLTQHSSGRQFDGDWPTRHLRTRKLRFTEGGGAAAPGERHSSQGKRKRRRSERRGPGHRHQPHPVLSADILQTAGSSKSIAEAGPSTRWGQDAPRPTPASRQRPQPCPAAARALRART